MSESSKNFNFKISNKKLFGKLIEFITDFIVIVSADGKTKYVSPSFYQSLGYTADETHNQYIFSFIHPDDLAKTKEDYKNLLAHPDIVQKVEIRLLHKDGSIRFISGNRKNLLNDPDVEGIILAGKDITDLVNTTSSLEENNKKLELHTRLLNVTESISKVGGWEYDIVNNKMFWTEETYRIHDIDPQNFIAGSSEHINKSLECYLPGDRSKIKMAFDNCISIGEAYDLEFPFVSLKGKNLWIRTIAKPIFENEKIVKLVGNIADITQRKKIELLAQARFRLIQYSYHSKLDQFLQRVLDEAEALTHSKIGFYHFVEPDQITLSLQAWSTNTIQNMCKAEGKGLHYDVDKAGVWVDCVHQRKTIVHNDYQSLTHKKGLPEGHAPVIREVVVPVFRDNKIVSILGVGNKENYYDENDIEMITEVADLAWDITERKRAEQMLAASEVKYRLLFDATPIGIGIADLEGKIVTSNPFMRELTGYNFENDSPQNVVSLYVNKEDRLVLLDNISKYGRVRDWEIELKRKDGSIFNALINVDTIELDGNKYLLTNLRDVTESRRHQKVIEESEKLKKTVLDSIYANVAVLDSTGNIITVNKPWENFAINNGVNNLIGTVEQVNYFDILYQSLENGDSSVVPILDGIKNVVNGNQPFFETEYPCDSPTEKRWFIMHAAQLENGKGAVVTHENITQRKIAEEQLKESEEKLKQLYNFQRIQNDELISKNIELKKARLSTLNIIEDLSREIKEHKLAQEIIKKSEQRFKTVADHTYDWEYWINPENKIEYMSPSCKRITGYDREDFFENPNLLENILHPDDAIDFNNHHPKNIDFEDSNNVYDIEYRIISKQGMQINIQHVCRPIFDDNKRYLGRRVSNRDITEKKRITQELIDAKNKAEEMNKVKSYFFANMSHELRTPFVGILGFSEMLTECLPDPEYKGYAEQILKSARRLTDTLNKILNITRLEFDKYEIYPEDVDINEMVLETSGLYSQSCKNNNSYIKTNLLFDKKLIKIDRRLVEEVLNNLISNAVKYTQDGVIEISNRRIGIENKNVLEIVISDTGLGIPNEMQDIIWQEFRQASEGYSRSFEGTGLGLTITKRYIELLGGKIYLQSEVGKGSTFTLHIPFEAVDTEIELVDKINKNELPAKVQEIQISKPKILYVEDDIISLDYIYLVLKSAYEIDTAFKVNKALELVNENNYDALLLDINLGRGIDGIELMQQIRQIKHYKNIPIVAVTAYAAETDKLEFLAKGFTHYLSKPFSSQELKDLLNKIFT